MSVGKKSGKRSAQSAIEPHEPQRIKAVSHLWIHPEWNQKLYAKGQVWTGVRMEGSTVIGDCFDCDLTQPPESCAPPFMTVIDGISRSFTCRSGFRVLSASPRDLQITYEQIPNISISATFRAPNRVYEKGFAKSIKYVDLLGDLGAAMSFEKTIPFKGAPVESHITKCSMRVFHLETEEIKCDVHETSEGSVVKWIPEMPQPTLIYAASTDVSCLKVYNVAKKKQLKILKGHTARIQELIVANGGRNLYSASQDGKILYWDMSRSEPIETLAAHPGCSINSMAIQTPEAFVVEKFNLNASLSETDSSRNGKVLLYGGEDEHLRIISLQSSKQKLFDYSVNDFICCCAFLNYPYFACGSDSGKLYYFDWRNPTKPVWQWTELRGAIMCMIGYGSGIICGAADGTCFMRDPVSNKNNDGAVEFCGSESDPIHRCCLNNGRMLTCCLDGKIRRYDFT